MLILLDSSTVADRRGRADKRGKFKNTDRNQTSGRVTLSPQTVVTKALSGKCPVVE